MTIEYKQQLLNDKIAVELDSEPAAKGRIKLPDWQKYLRGTVIAVGPGRALPNGERAPMVCKVGDRISFPPTAGMDANLGSTQQIRLMRDDDVECVWEDGEMEDVA